MEERSIETFPPCGFFLSLYSLGTFRCPTPFETLLFSALLFFPGIIFFHSMFPFLGNKRDNTCALPPPVPPRALTGPLPSLLLITLFLGSSDSTLFFFFSRYQKSEHVFSVQTSQSCPVQCYLSFVLLECVTFPPTIDRQLMHLRRASFYQPVWKHPLSFSSTAISFLLRLGRTSCRQVSTSSSLSLIGSSFFFVFRRKERSPPFLFPG